MSQVRKLRLGPLSDGRSVNKKKDELVCGLLEQDSTGSRLTSPVSNEQKCFTQLLDTGASWVGLIELSVWLLWCQAKPWFRVHTEGGREETKVVSLVHQKKASKTQIYPKPTWFCYCYNGNGPSLLPPLGLYGKFRYLSFSLSLMFALA